mgnify:CR=1 FL=1
MNFHDHATHFLIIKQHDLNCISVSSWVQFLEAAASELDNVSKKPWKSCIFFNVWNYSQSFYVLSKSTLGKLKSNYLSDCVSKEIEPNILREKMNNKIFHCKSFKNCTWNG